MSIIEKLPFAVNLWKRNFYIGQGEWRPMTRNGRDRCVLPPPPPAARGYAEIGRIFRESGNCDLEVLEMQADSENISGVDTLPPQSKKERAD